MIVSRLLCTNAVGSHGSGGTLPLQWWARRTCPSFKLCDRAKLARHPRLRPLVPLAVVEHNRVAVGDRLTL